ncbi:MAG: FAD-dependent oxidoreductase, partial [Phycisphaerales bacterium]
MTDPDVFVIGGGPAGACAAIAAAQAGARVMLVERAQFPRPKVCGCCLSDAAVAGLESLDAGHVLHDAVPIDAVRLATGTREARLPRAGGVALSDMHAARCRVRGEPRVECRAREGHAAGAREARFSRARREPDRVD